MTQPPVGQKALFYCALCFHDLFEGQKRRNVCPVKAQTRPRCILAKCVAPRSEMSCLPQKLCPCQGHACISLSVLSCSQKDIILILFMAHLLTVKPYEALMAAPICTSASIGLPEEFHASYLLRLYSICKQLSSRLTVSVGVKLL